MAKRKIVLSGREDDLKAAITLLLGIHQLIEQQDIGQFVGVPLVEYLRPAPQPLKLTLFFFLNPEPPWIDRSTAPQITIPFIKRSRVDDWNRIKKACGGKNGYRWGRWLATANLQHDSGIRKLRVHGGSEAEAEDRLLDLAELSDGKIVSLGVKEEKKFGQRIPGKPLYKETVRVYPGYFTIINQEKTLREAGKGNLDGNRYISEKVKVDLWTSKKPSNYSAIIAELLKKGDLA